MWIIFFLLLTGFVQADVYVLTDANKSVVGLSEQNDIVAQAGQKVEVLKNKQIKDLTMTMGEEKLYDFNGKTFTLNSKKVQEQAKAESDYILEKQQKDQNKNSAILKLKDVVKLTDDEIEAILK